jgi:predicted nucleic acid-binding protein
MTYLLDANVFIQAKNLHYGFDFCPAFWEWIEQKNSEDVVFSIDKVSDELLGGSDQLADWTKLHPAMFRETDKAVIPALKQVSDWVTAQKYESAAVSTFLQVADYWLVAHALATGFTVVTHEQASDSVRKIKIPNVCIALGIPVINVFALLRREGARFVLPRDKGSDG